MTNREFFVAISTNPSLSAEIVEHATAQIAKLDETNAKRRNAMTKKQLENQPLKDLLAQNLSSKPQTATDMMGVIECSVQKTSNLLRQLVADGRADVVDVKIPKKGMQKGYTVKVSVE